MGIGGVVWSPHTNLLVWVTGKRRRSRERVRVKLTQKNNKVHGMERSFSERSEQFHFSHVYYAYLNRVMQCRFCFTDRQTTRQACFSHLYFIVCTYCVHICMSLIIIILRAEYDMYDYVSMTTYYSSCLVLSDVRTSSMETCFTTPPD